MSRLILTNKRSQKLIQTLLTLKLKKKLLIISMVRNKKKLKTQTLNKSTVCFDQDITINYEDTIIDFHIDV